MLACFCSTRKNGHIVLLIKVGNKGCAIGNFIKFGGGGTLHQNKTMACDYILVVISLDLETIIALQYPLFDHDPPICIMK